ncbi:hypothetical protein Tsubulata_027473 [Turnera subulata]|uniref:Uncharacterized protein n=1 Tax=Turnera subulata TaxID=218843 RepID=A0A9Q0F3Y3_9ROSI|nr:hypothetical protein Tsubulata_027473 [Turnera subulata]
MEDSKVAVGVVAGELETLANATKNQNVHWNRRSIYKVPASLSAMNRPAYSPQTVSLGPYHCTREDLKPMEEHKQRALRYFLKRTKKPLPLFVEALSPEVQILRDSYDQLDKSWQGDDKSFLKLMILDGCFLLEIMNLDNISTDFSNYDKDDPVFSSHGKLYVVPHIQRDMLMIENQLPMLVLYKLVAPLHDGIEDHDYVNNLVLGFFRRINKPESQGGKFLHVLDLYRKSLLMPPAKPQQPSRRRPPKRRTDDNNWIIRSATELDEAGVTLKKSESTSLEDIRFRRGVLRLPAMVVDDATEAMFLNLIALERLHVGTGNQVTSYVCFMDSIIDTERDVALLHSKGIVRNALGSDKAVAKMFNSLSKDLTPDLDSSLGVIRKDVSAYCKKKWNEWRANLIHTYFRSPWALLTVIAASILFALTVAQTVYTIYPYYNTNDSPPPPSAPPPTVSVAPPPAPAPAPAFPPPKRSRRPFH